MSKYDFAGGGGACAVRPVRHRGGHAGDCRPWCRHADATAGDGGLQAAQELGVRVPQPHGGRRRLGGGRLDRHGPSGPRHHRQGKANRWRIICQGLLSRPTSLSYVYSSI
eukprot:scaffold337077_cov17-Prasinocladus_malaysianus.AAC.1